MPTDLWRRLHVWFVPSHHNDFHPHLIAERGLLILFALILGAEGFLVSNVVSLESGTPSLAAVSAPQNFQSAALPPPMRQISAYWYHYVVASLANLAMRPGAGKFFFFMLLGVAVLLMGLIALTISMRRRRYKPVGYVAGGTMLALAATLLFFNTHVLFPYAAQLQMAAIHPSMPLEKHAASPALLPTSMFATSTGN